MIGDKQISSSKQKINLSLDLRLISILLLIIIIVMLSIWKPWSPAPAANDRTISVTGQATLKAEPDEYVFYPSYQFKGSDKSAAIAELTSKSDSVVTELKKLGVADSKIKTNSSGYDAYSVPVDVSTNGNATYTLGLTVTVGNRQLAQKIQTYLITTSPTGSVSPQADFSDTKRKQLDDQARDEATKDARTKADQSARNLGFTLGKVKQVNDSTGFTDIRPLNGAPSPSSALDTKQQLSVQPGQNNLSYAVTVIYFVK